MKLSGRKSVFAGCLAVLAACGGDPTGLRGERMELGMARALWDARGTDDYRMTVRLVGAWIGGAAVIRVRDGVPVSVEPVQPSNGLTASAFASHDTVEELFGVLERAVEQGADRIDAEYHGQLGLPVDVAIDVHEDAIDDEHGFIVQSFERE